MSPTTAVDLSGLIESLHGDLEALRQQHATLTLAIRVLEQELAVALDGWREALDGWREALGGMPGDVRARQEHVIRECRSHVDTAIELVRLRSTTPVRRPA